MPKRTNWYIWILTICVLALKMPLWSQDTSLSLSFSQLAAHAEKYSPELRLIRQSTELDLLDSRLPLQLSNPTLEVSHEFVKNNDLSQREQAITLSKSFEMPWYYSSKQQLHRQRARALQLEKESRYREFLCQIKSDYAALRLLSECLNAYQEVEKHLFQVTKTVANRKNEGFIVGYQQKVIDIALLNLKGEMLQLTGTRRMLENRFRTALGIAVDAELILTTPITFIPFNSEDLQTAANTLDQTPAYRHREEMTAVLTLAAIAEKQSIIPDITLSAGYKSVGPDLNGYTVGLSFNLPLLNHNRVNIAKKQLECDMHKDQSTRFKQEQILRIREKILKITEYGAYLKEMDRSFRSVKNQFAPIVLALQEGALSISDFVNILQTYSQGMKLYYQYMQEYFDTLFQLEAITGKNYITL